MKSSECSAQAASVGAVDSGYVFEAYDNRNKKKVALKRIEKVGNSLSREYEILFDIKNCDHAVKILVGRRNQDFYYSRNSQNKLIQNIVFEYMEDNLEAMIQEKVNNLATFSETEVKLFIFQILKGLEYIHSKSSIDLRRHRAQRPQA
jgi:serine/threonine protein kinase